MEVIGTATGIGSTVAARRAAIVAARATTALGAGSCVASGGGWLAAASRAAAAVAAVRFAVVGFAAVRSVVVGEVAVVGRHAPAVALVAGAVGPAQTGPGVRGVGRVAAVAGVAGVAGGGVVGAEPPVGDPILSGDVVEDVEVGGRAEAVHPLLRERPDSLYTPARAFTCASAASVASAGRSRPDSATAPDDSRNIVTRDRRLSAAFRRRSARPGSTSAAIAVAIRSIWV